LSKDEDFARAVLEDQLAGLKELADIGREAARGLGGLIARGSDAAEPNPQFDVVAINRALDRTVRAVRLCYALQHVVIDRLRGVGRIEIDQAERAERARAAEARARDAAAKANDPVHVRKLQISKVVDGIITDAHDGDGEALDRHVREAERLRDHEVLDNVLGRPASEVIADICRLLGLEPNWEGLAFEAWAQEELESGKVGAPLQSPPPWMGPRPGVRGRLLKSEAAEAEPPLAQVPDELPVIAETEEPPPPTPQEAEVAPDPPPYIPPPDPDILPGYPVGLPGELPPLRPGGRRARPMPSPRNYTYGFD
jgi:hypothetical protein